MRARVRLLVQAFGGGTVAAMVGALWVTEDALPMQTQVGFAAVVVVGIGWVVVAVRALWKQGRLFAIDRVVAGWLGLGFAVVLAVGLVLMGLSTVAGIVVAGAGVVLVRAQIEYGRLQRMVPIGPLGIALERLGAKRGTALLLVGVLIALLVVGLVI